MKKGILVQGPVTEWTADIIKEYRDNFDDIEILLSTWKNEDVSEIECEILQVEPPEKTYPHQSSINLQIKGAQEGLKRINADMILKTKTDQFIHNNEIFNIFENECKDYQIMTTDLNSWRDRDYRITDFCQLATKKVLEEYWNNMPFYDGSYAIPPEVYLTKNYVVNFKKDNKPWSEIIDNYFCIKDYYRDFKMEFEKFVSDESKQEWFKKNMSVDE